MVADPGDVIVVPIDDDRVVSPDPRATLAEAMTAVDPWRKLGINADRLRAVMGRPGIDVQVAVSAAGGGASGGGAPVGCAVFEPRWIWGGYVRSLFVDTGWRGRGVGGRLLDRVEEIVFRDAPNVFLCVSSFNDRARAFYEARGYRRAGELVDFWADGLSETILRKSLGPVRGYRPPPGAG